ncbi:Uncharacterized membrane protein [Paenibacillus catalpae]|uniref:Uncharacterized membrane protein n=1 Tax=Paenibacillus catalpae TaxID=1045775 RepID=A0A1I1X8Q0_9BACL|nr:DUF2243 domain-containing protein [Paenibacillus catalpae]SFE03796.1 Uncharacterized membrane protein [Paenibacillus catalpae]
MSNRTKQRSKDIPYKSRNLWSGILFGLGMVAFIDETVFHQLLHWHHFYDKSTTDIGLASDGLFHAFSWIATIGGLFILADLRRKHALLLSRWCGGVQLGAGFFQLYDGTIQHKLMRLHQIRYVDHVFIYDLIWNIAACLMILNGLFLAVRSRGRHEHGEASTYDHE